MIILLDHDNIPFDRVDLLSILRAWLSQLRSSGDLASDGVQSLRVRAYGGWFSDANSSRARYEAADFYQTTCPSVFNHDGRFVRVSFEFADYLIEHHVERPTDLAPVRITHSVAERKSLPWMRPVSTLECLEPECELSTVRRWLRKKRGCAKNDCRQSFSDCFYRLEQKQVDVHLALDLQAYATGSWPYMRVALASDDWDLLPALSLAAGSLPPSRTLTVLRFTRAGTYLDPVLLSRGVRIVEL